ncbi:hypothetical protein FACS1894110_20140 [Spirochaetia bacterium]|nr:hypothetical protein FACS1894110_20140 [Spirochaetia bacterium]
MFKRMLTGALIGMIIAITPVFTQTWVEADDGESVKIEYTEITKAQFNRLLRQFETTKTHVSFGFEDALLKKPSPAKIISGRKPVFNDYYYLLMKITVDQSNLTADERMYAAMAEGEYLIYGHKDTGELTISFPDAFTAMFAQALSPAGIAEINSDDYKQKIERFLGLVEGK